MIVLKGEQTQTSDINERRYSDHKEIRDLENKEIFRPEFVNSPHQQVEIKLFGAFRKYSDVNPLILEIRGVDPLDEGSQPSEGSQPAEGLPLAESTLSVRKIKEILKMVLIQKAHIRANHFERIKGPQSEQVSSLSNIENELSSLMKISVLSTETKILTEEEFIDIQSEKFIALLPPVCGG